MQKKFQPYLDMLLMILPATLFYGVAMSNLPAGVFQGYFYLLAKTILFLLPGLVVIKLRLSDFGITTNGLKLSLLLFLPSFLTWNQIWCHGINRTSVLAQSLTKL